MHLETCASLVPSFFSGCECLTSVDLSPLGVSLEAIGDRFMAECTAITQLDITPLSNSRSRVVEVGTGMLEGCEVVGLQPTHPFDIEALAMDLR